MTKVDKKDIQFTPPSLDKLAQLEHPLKINELQGRKSLQKKARAKCFTNALLYRLTRLDSPLHKSYLNSYYCSSVYEQKGQTLTTTYCNNRWCIVCNRIRTAKLINGYMTQLQALQDPYFVTLTIPNVKGEILQEAIEKMLSTMSSIIHRWQVHHKEDKINGVRKIECTYNPNTNTFHPHFHLIVDKKEHAQYIVDQWLTHNKNAQRIAQDIRPCDSQQSLLELFKYFTKVLTNKHDFYAPQMDVIFQAMRKKRVYQPFGNIHPITEDIEDISKEEYTDLVNEDKVWTWLENDWVDTETGEFLSGYTPSEEFKTLIDNILHK